MSTERNPLSCVVEVPLDSGTWKLLVGTEVLSVDGKKSAGYFEGTNAIAMPLSSMSFPPGKDAPVTSSSSIYSTSVNDKPVRAFLYDGDTTAGTLFIGISPYASTKTYYGLYSSTWNNGTSWSGWRAE